MQSNIIVSFTRNKISPSEKVAPSEEVVKGTKTFDDMDNTNFTEKPKLLVRNDSVIRDNKEKQMMGDLDDEEATKYSGSPSDKKEEGR